MSTAKAKRDAAIVAMYEDGATTHEVADRFGLSAGRVAHIVRALKPRAMRGRVQMWANFRARHPERAARLFESRRLEKIDPDAAAADEHLLQRYEAGGESYGDLAAAFDCSRGAVAGAIWRARRRRVDFIGPSKN